MGLRINQNIDAMNAYRNLSHTDSALSTSLQRLSSGLRINSAADDAAGLSISQDLQSQINGFKVATQNAQDANSLLQTADGALTETTALLQRVRNLTVQSANVGANDQASRDAIGNEVQAALDEIDRIASATVYGSSNILDGSVTGGFTFHLGFNGNAYNQVNISIGAMSSGALGLTGSSLVSQITGTNAASALAQIDMALTTVTATRSTIGAYENRLQSTMTNLAVAVENLSSSLSRIQDTDMAEEMTNYSKLQILEQAGTSMLAQANKLPQSVVTLIQNAG
jgi:flagellin